MTVRLAVMTNATLIARLANEGLVPLVDAARAVRVPCSLWQLIRAAVAGRLEAVKVGGCWQSTPAAVVRWIAAATESSRRPRARKSKRTAPAARRYLESVGAVRREGGQ